jgi:hypothetical protein
VLPPEHDEGAPGPPPRLPGGVAVSLLPPPNWSEPLAACLFVEDEDDGFTAVVHAATRHALKNGTTNPRTEFA